jgi:hypothetical protein
MFSELLLSQTKIDENITITFPGKPETIEDTAKKDTLDSSFNSTLKAYFLNSKEDSYIAMRVKVLIGDNLDAELPTSTLELKKKYKQFIDDHLKSMSKKGLFFKDSTEIKLNNFIAYKINFKAESSEQEIGESIILSLNGITYVFIYSKVDSYNLINKETFFKSIKINNPENLKQITEPYNYWSALIKILSGVILLFLIIKFKKSLKHS